MAAGPATNARGPNSFHGDPGPSTLSYRRQQQQPQQGSRSTAPSSNSIAGQRAYIPFETTSASQAASANTVPLPPRVDETSSTTSLRYQIPKDLAVEWTRYPLNNSEAESVLPALRKLSFAESQLVAFRTAAKLVPSATTDDDISWDRTILSQTLISIAGISRNEASTVGSEVTAASHPSEDDQAAVHGPEAESISQIAWLFRLIRPDKDGSGDSTAGSDSKKTDPPPISPSEEDDLWGESEDLAGDLEAGFAEELESAQEAWKEALRSLQESSE